MESLILRLASKFPGRRDQLLFLINNYDVVSHASQMSKWRWNHQYQSGDVHHHRANQGWLEGVGDIPGAAEESERWVCRADARAAFWSPHWVRLSKMNLNNNMYHLSLYHCGTLNISDWSSGGWRMRSENWMQVISRDCDKRRDGCPTSYRPSALNGRSPLTKSMVWLGTNNSLSCLIQTNAQVR